MPGKYKPYPEYKQTSKGWLKFLPIDWNVKKLKFTSSCNNDSIGENTDKDYEIEYVDIGSVSATEGVKTSETMMFGAAPSRARRKVRDGDVIISTVRTYLEAIAPIKKSVPNLIVSTGFAVIRPKKLLGHGYAAYVLRARGFIKEVVIQSVGISYPAINATDLVNIKIPLPSIQEQTQIANFLDHETAKIDKLIEKQQQLIRLLEEKRQAVVSHAVTKGLNPNAPMKDSGIKWLGQIPAHWEVARLKYRTVLFEQGWSPQCDLKPAAKNEYGVLKVGCVNSGIFNCYENKALPIGLEPKLQYLLKKGDLLISRANTRELVGSAAVVGKDYFNLILCDKLYRLRFEKSVNPQLIAFFLALPTSRQQIEITASGASQSMVNIGQSTIKELYVVFPPKAEADVLVTRTKDRVHAVNLITGKAKKQIKLLHERRTALISAAVTGKIDVRDWSCKAKVKQD